MNIPDNSFNESINNNENEIIPENEVKNIYLKKDDISEIKLISKNEMICDGKKYKINEYFEEINNNSGNYLDDSIYDYCKNCRKNKNKYFAKIVIKIYVKNVLKILNVSKMNILRGLWIIKIIIIYII